MGKELIAGISFADKNAQIALLEIRNGEASVVHLEEFDALDGDEFWYLEPLLMKRSKIFKKVSKVSVAIDNERLFLYAFPMDSTLSQSDQREQLQWELSNYIPQFRPQEYINEVHTLKVHPHEQVMDCFVVSAKRTAVHRLQSALAGQGFELSVIDSNHFSGQYTLLLNYPEIRTKIVGILSVQIGRIDFGLLQNGRLTEYQYETVSTGDAVGGRLQEYLQGLENPEVFAYGPALTDPLIASIKEGSNISLTKLDPFRRLPVSRSFDDFNLMAGQEHRFAACVGIALRKQ